MIAVSVRPSPEGHERYIDPEPLIALWPLRVPVDGSEVGLVTCRAEGRRRLYSLDPARLRPVQEWLTKYERALHERLDRMDDYLKELQQQGEPQ